MQGLQAAQEAALAAASKSASKAINKDSSTQRNASKFLGTKMTAKHQAAEKDAKEAAFQEALATWMGVGCTICPNPFFDATVGWLSFCDAKCMRPSTGKKPRPTRLSCTIFLEVGWCQSPVGSAIMKECFHIKTVRKCRDAPRVATGIER